MSTTIRELSAALDEVAAAAREVMQREQRLNRLEQEHEEEMSRREADLAEGLEAFVAARQTSAIWAEATAARDRHWITLIGLQLEQLQPQCNTATVLRRLQAIATCQQQQMEG